MDIVTHALMGAVIAGPLLPSRPLTAACFIAGSVLPDLDVLSRVFGRRAFLRWHQTYTHGLAAIAAAGLIAWVAVPRSFAEPWAAAALAGGMLLHVGLDVTNTFGTAVLSPLSPRRFCTEWVFFIDAVVVAATVAALLAQWLVFDFERPGARIVSLAYLLFLAIYLAFRAGLYSRAKRKAPLGTVSLIPSALVPWCYFGYASLGDGIRVFRVNALSGIVDQQWQQDVLDKSWAGVLARVPEFGIMRQLTPAYHVVGAEAVAEGTRLTCRDLRVRNFGGHFGELTVIVGPAGGIVRSEFNV